MTYDREGFLICPFETVNDGGGDLLMAPAIVRERATCNCWTGGGAPDVFDMTVFKIQYNSADETLIANDPNSYLWNNDPVPFAAWLQSKGGRKSNFGVEIQSWDNRPELAQIKAANDLLPD